MLRRSVLSTDAASLSLSSSLRESACGLAAPAAVRAPTGFLPLLDTAAAAGFLPPLLLFSSSLEASSSSKRVRRFALLLLLLLLLLVLLATLTLTFFCGEA